MAKGLTGGMVVVSAHVPEDRARWLAVWLRWPAREVFAHPAYAELEADGEHSVAKAAILETVDGTVIYPFVQRRLETEAWWTPEIGTVSDITAPYGYGGPFVWGDGDRKTLTSCFWDSFAEWVSDERIVSEFVRFSLFENGRLPYPGRIEERQANVVCTLAMPLDAMWMNFDHKVRKNVKKARRSGIVVVRDEGALIDSFLSIYAHTMNRRTADGRYRFSEEYFDRLRETLPGQFCFFHALLDERVVSTELVLISAENVYSFLGGTRESAFEFRPNDLLKYEIILWAKEQGKSHFVLGGGYEPDDGIFRYKLSFAPTGRTPFFIGQRVFMPDQYAQLVKRRIDLSTRQGTEGPRQGFFPLYRG